MKNIYILFAALLPALALPLHGADSGNEVIVVYNTRVPESKEVADYYAKARNVPMNQVFGFALSTSLEMSRAEFRDSLQTPLARILEEKRLWHIASEIVRATNGKPARVDWKVKESKIRYAVLCYGVPVSIARDPNLKEIGDDKMRPELRRDEAAVDTELALLPCIEEKLPLMGPCKNPLFSFTNAASFNPTNGVLMVTRLDGPTAEIARGLVDKALQAETNGLWGRAYFDLRDTTDPAYKSGDDWIRGAAEICQRLGFETVVDNKPETFAPEFPMSQIAIYCGWYDVNVSGPFTRPHVEFMPGAFAYHLHSYSAANLRSATQNWVGPLLAKGATITMGCVNEPFLGGTPQVALFAARLIYDRMTFGEAAYAAQPVLSWQTTIVGDPLYCPFGKPGQELHEELQRKHSGLIEWSFLRIADLNLAKGTPLRAVASFLEQIDATRHSAVLTEKLADLYGSLGKPESAIETYEKALQLDPSPQQRVRLRLTLGEKLMAVSQSEDKNKYKEALENYTEMLRENPDYPNKLAVYQKLLPIAQKLDMKQDAERYEELITTLTPPPPDNKK
jgi:uncharacterized protein (TIGR03790 family)